MPEPQHMTGGLPVFRNLLRSLFIDAVLPILSYHLLVHYGVPVVHALAISAVFPAGKLIGGIVVSRRIDPIGIIVLIFIVVGVTTSLISGNVLFALIKESFITAAFGFVLLGSLVARRPLMFYFGRQAVAGDDPVRIAAWESRWHESEGFRRRLRQITAVWGFTYLVEAIARLVLALTLTPGVVVTVSPLMAIGVTVALIIWTRNVARARQAAAQELAPAEL